MIVLLALLIQGLKSSATDEWHSITKSKCSTSSCAESIPWSLTEISLKLQYVGVCDFSIHFWKGADREIVSIKWSMSSKKV